MRPRPEGDLPSRTLCDGRPSAAVRHDRPSVLYSSLYRYPVRLPYSLNPYRLQETASPGIVFV